MALDGLFGTSINILGKNLDFRAQNHNHISANIANAETPGYTPTTLSFEKELKVALKEKETSSLSQINSGNIALTKDYYSFDSVQANVVETTAGTPGRDGNSVEMENEMGKLMENQILYNADVQLLTRKFQDLTLAIKGT